MAHGAHSSTARGRAHRKQRGARSWIKRFTFWVHPAGGREAVTGARARRGGSLQRPPAPRVTAPVSASIRRRGKRSRPLWPPLGTGSKSPTGATGPAVEQAGIVVGVFASHCPQGDDAGSNDGLRRGTTRPCARSFNG